MKWARLGLAAVSIAVLATTLGTTAGQVGSTPEPKYIDKNLNEFRLIALKATPSPTPAPTPVPTPAPPARVRTRPGSIEGIPVETFAGRGDAYDSLADCETGKRYKKNGIWYIIWGTRTNLGCAKYCGYFQFLQSTWNKLGGPGSPPQHPYETQKYYAKKIPISAWDSQFPSCNRILKTLGVI